MKFRRLGRALLAILFATGCGGSSEPFVYHIGDTAPAPIADRAIDGVHDVVCGCEIESIGVCGNYAVIDGTPVPLGGDLDLGPMEFCGASGLRAHVVGHVSNGTLVATSLDLRE